MTDLCSIKICGSSTWCEICGLAWDTNDDEPGCAIIPNSPAELAARNALTLGEKRGRLAMQREIVAMIRARSAEAQANEDKLVEQYRLISSWEELADDLRKLADELERMP